MNAEFPFSAKAGRVKTVDLNREDKTLDAFYEAVFGKKFDGMSRKDSDTLKEYLVSGVHDEESYADLKNKAIELGVDPDQAERIVRTEAHELRNKARELNYAETQSPDALYKWIGPDDSRTTTVCKAIEKRTAKGVPIDKLKAIIDEEGRKAGFDPREFTPHINCRHTFVRRYE